MKIRNLIGIISFFIVCSFPEAMGMVAVTGKALPGETVSLQQNQNAVIRNVATVKAGDEGGFRLEFPDGKTGLYTLRAQTSGKNMLLFLRSGEQAGVVLTGDRPLFTGKSAPCNQLLQELSLQEAIWAKQWPAIYGRADHFREAATKRWQARKEFLVKADLKDPEAIGILTAYGMVQYYSELLKFPFFYQLLTGSTVELPDEYYSFLQQVDLSSPYLNNLGNTNSFLQELFTAMEERGGLTGTKENYLIQRVELIPDPSVREDYLLYVVGNVELMGYNQYLGKQLKMLSSFILTPEGQETWKELCGKYEKQAQQNECFNAGQPAVEFVGTDVQGKQHRLSDYRGKVVVVDVWNTGCKPCIAEIPYLKKLEKKFEGKEVVFISYSLDTNPQRWKQFRDKHQMQGNQWINTGAFKSDFAKAYRVRFIPRFMVFRKDGKMADVYAPRPSNPRLARMIEEELNR